jgi:hypothetical protein
LLANRDSAIGKLGGKLSRHVAFASQDELRAVGEMLNHLDHASGEIAGGNARARTPICVTRIVRPNRIFRKRGEAVESGRMCRAQCVTRSDTRRSESAAFGIVNDAFRWVAVIAGPATLFLVHL